VLDRIEVNVIDVALEIPVVADGVLPEATLPKRVFSIRVARDGNARSRGGGRESTLDQGSTDLRSPRRPPAMS
jgi:hypothetical protein